MRRIFLLMNVSLEGYFEGAGHDISAFNSGNEAFSSDGGEGMDTLLLGHRTYDLMKSYWPTPQAAEAAPQVASFMNAVQKVVVSRQPFEPGWENVTVANGDGVEAVRKLKEGPGKTIGIFGSNTLTVSLVEAGLIDEFLIIVNPVALGEGTPLFKGLSKRVNFTLKETRKFQSGAAMLTYVPA